MRQNKKHTPFFQALRHLAYLRLAIFQPYANHRIASHTASMNQLQYRNVAKSTSIRTRYKSETSIEQVKLRVLKNVFDELFRGYPNSITSLKHILM